MNESLFPSFPCDKKPGESQFSPTHAWTIKEDNGKSKTKRWAVYGVREDSPVGVRWIDGGKKSEPVKKF